MPVIFHTVSVSPYDHAEGVKNAIRRALRTHPGTWYVRVVQQGTELALSITGEDGRQRHGRIHNLLEIEVELARIL